MTLEFARRDRLILNDDFSKLLSSNTNVDNETLDNAAIGEKLFQADFYTDKTKLPEKIQMARTIGIVLDSHIGDSVLTIHVSVLLRKYLETHKLENTNILLYVSPYLLPMLQKFKLGDGIQLRALTSIDVDQRGFTRDDVLINFNRHDAIEHLYRSNGGSQRISGEIINMFYFGLPPQGSHKSLGAILVRAFERMLGEKIVKSPEGFLRNYQTAENFLLRDFDVMIDKYESLKDLVENEYVIVQPNSSKDFKSYPASKWLEVITDILERFSEKKVLILERTDVKNILDDIYLSDLRNRYSGRIVCEHVDIGDLPEIIDAIQLHESYGVDKIDVGEIKKAIRLMQQSMLHT